jgi:hypothetical protein
LTSAELRQQNIVAFSYFYDRAIDTGILPEGATEGKAKIKSFVEAANKACYKDVPDDAAFLCVDLVSKKSCFLRRHSHYGQVSQSVVHW